MTVTEITLKDKQMALKCVNCIACKKARKKQKGLIFFFVKKIESDLCPYCKAYEKVYGKKAHVGLIQTTSNSQL